MHSILQANIWVLFTAALLPRAGVGLSVARQKSITDTREPLLGDCARYLEECWRPEYKDWSQKVECSNTEPRTACLFLCETSFSEPSTDGYCEQGNPMRYKKQRTLVSSEGSQHFRYVMPVGSLQAESFEDSIILNKMRIKSEATPFSAGNQSAQSPVQRPVPMNDSLPIAHTPTLIDSTPTDNDYIPESFATWYAVTHLHQSPSSSAGSPRAIQPIIPTSSSPESNREDSSDNDAVLGHQLIEPTANNSYSKLWTYDPGTDEIMVDKPLVFLHIPLNFGSSIEEVGASRDFKWGIYQRVSRMPMRDGHKCHTAFVPPYLVPVPNMYTGSEVFTVVRHPYVRALSEYKHLLGVEWGDAWESIPRNEKPCTPSSLNGFLQTILTRVMQGERYINDCHMLPQMEYIAGSFRRFAKWELGDILREENMPDAFNALMKNRSHDLRLDARNIVNSHDDLCPELTVQDMSNETKTMLNTVYFEDFKSLHYDPY